MAKFKRLKHGILYASRSSIGMRRAISAMQTGPITKASFHHGGEVGPAPLSFARASGRWRSFQTFHMQSRGWHDIGYNLGMDGLGRLYAGRPVGTLPAAVAGFNSNSVGIVAMQDGDKHELNLLQRRTLRILFKYGVPELGLPPLRTLQVRGHNEHPSHESNACPGRHIMRHLRWRRAQDNR